MKRLPLWALDHAGVAGVLIAVLTIAFALQIPQLEIDPSAEGLMVQGDPARRYYEEVKDKFGSDNLTVVLIKANDVFAVPVLQAVQRMSDALERLEGVSHVESLTTVTNVRAVGNTLHTHPLVDEIPAEGPELARIRADALGNRALVGNIVSKDAKATALNIFTDSAPADKRFNKRFSEQVEGIIKPEGGTGLFVYQIGLPLTKAIYVEYIEQDTLELIPIALVAVLAILLLAFRTLQAAVIPMVTGGLSIVWALGLMALFNLPLTTLTSMIPSLLIAIGFTEDVHMLSEYHHRLRAGDDKLLAIRTMARTATLPILVTTLTTVVGFGSLITTDITMLIQFGYASAMGLTANFIVTVVVLPLMLRVWSVPRRFRPVVFAEEAAHGSISPMVERLAEFNVRHRIAIAAVAGLVIAGSLAGWYSLRVNNDFISFFPERSVIRQRVQDLHDSLAGAVLFYMIVETHREGGAKEPDVLRSIAELQGFLAGTGQIDKSVSMADHVRKLHREMNGGDPAFESIPDTREEVAQYLLTLEGRELAQYVDFDASTANIVVRHNLTSSSELSALLKRLDAFAAKTLPAGVTVRYTGETILINNAADYMAINELTSFSLTFIAIGLVHSLLFMSVRAGLLSLVPNVIPVLTNFGLMGLLGIPLNVGTAMIATIAIGIAVDDTVHHMVTFSRQLRVHRDPKIAMLKTLQTQARPIISISVALAGGFLVLIFSNFVPTAQFGVLSALVMLVAMVGELTLTPILMYSARLVPLRETAPASPAESMVVDRNRTPGDGACAR